MLKRVTDRPQRGEYDSELGHYICDDTTTLKEFLDYIPTNFKSWGHITILDSNDEIIRKFDYDLLRENIFYYNFDTGYYDYYPERIYTNSCWCSCDFTIKLSNKKKPFKICEV